LDKFRAWLGPFSLLLTIPVFFAVSLAEKPEKALSSISKIEQAYQVGEISRADRIFYNAQAILRPEEVPAMFLTLTPVKEKSGTHYVLEAWENIALLTSPQQTLLLQYLARPTLDTTYISPDSRFAIHYDTEGVTAVPLEDSDLDGIPDYVERVAGYADSSRRAYFNLGYLPVPRDADTLYDIFLVNNIGAYGVTIPENPADSSWDDYSSYMKMHSTFLNFPPNDDPEGDVVGAQKVTSAHEYFHATQLAYNVYQDRWWMECTAVFFEEILFPEVNDNYQYLDEFYDFPETRLDGDSWHMYSSFIWADFLTSIYGMDLIRDIFEYGLYFDALASTDSALAQHGKNIASIFSDFTLWNFYTDQRAIPGQYFMAAADYPLIRDTILEELPYSVYTATAPPDGLAANYLISYPRPGDDGYVRFFFVGTPSVKWDFTYIAYKAGEAAQIVQPQMGYQSARTEFGWYDIALLDSIVMIPCVVSRWMDNNTYTISTDLVIWGDLDRSGSVNILDIVFLIDYKFKNGPPPPYEENLADFTCGQSVNILDIIYLINYKFKGGLPPGPCRP